MADREEQIAGLYAALARLEAHREELDEASYATALAAIQEQLAELGEELEERENGAAAG